MAGALSLARDGFDVRRLDAAEAGLPQGAFVVPDATGLEDAAQATAAQHVLRIERVQGTVPAGRPFRQPKVALYSPSAYYDAESAPHLRYLFEQVWTMPYTPFSATEVLGGALARDGYEVFVVPGVTTGKLIDAKDDVEAWIAAGGVFVGATVGDGAGGTPFAVAAGWTSSSLSSPPGFHVPGSLFRVARGPGRAAHPRRRAVGLRDEQRGADPLAVDHRRERVRVPDRRRRLLVVGRRPERRRAEGLVGGGRGDARRGDG